MNILIIKHGAFGDMINAMGAFAALRDAYPTASLTLLTSATFQAMAQATPYFDHIKIDPRSRNPICVAHLCFELKRTPFNRVFDLQNSKRTTRYFQLMKWLPGRMPLWSGIAPGCSHPQRRPDRRQLHAFQRFVDQLTVAGVDLKGRQALRPEMGWLQADLSHFSLPTRYAMLVPGSSKTGAYKRWPLEKYKRLAEVLLARDIMPVLVGGPDEQDLLAWLAQEVPQSRSLSGQLSLLEIGVLARGALIAIGNDTGAMHLAAAVGCPTAVLWSNASDPAVFGPQGPHVRIIYKDQLADLSCDEVVKALEDLLDLSNIEGLRHG